MAQDRLYKLFEKQRKRQIAALLAVCTPEEKERIKIARKAGQEMRRRVAATERSEVDGGHTESPIDLGKASVAATRYKITERSLENEQLR